MYLIIITLMNNLITGLEALKQAFEELNLKQQEKVKQLQEKIDALEKENADLKATLKTTEPIFASTQYKETAKILAELEPTQKFNQIKHIRSIFGLGLKESKDLVEEANP